MTEEVYDDSLEGTTTEVKNPEIVHTFKKISNIDKVRKFLSDGKSYSMRQIMVGSNNMSVGNIHVILNSLVDLKEIKIVICGHCDSTTKLYTLK